MENGSGARLNGGGSQGHGAALVAGLPLLSSEVLLKGGNEVLIEHGNCVYSLRVTRQGKLILTK